LEIAGAPHRRQATFELSGDGGSGIIACRVCMLIPNSSTAYFRKSYFRKSYFRKSCLLPG
jgi:hypothetical protein